MTLLWCRQSMLSPTLGNVIHLLSVGGTLLWRCWARLQQGTLTPSPSSVARWYRSQQAIYICCWTILTLTPCQLWEQVGGGGGKCGVLLNWIRAALTMQSSTATPPTTLPSPILLGKLSKVFLLIWVQPVHHWEVLCTDLPALDQSRLAPPDQMASLVDVLWLKNAAARQD